jgi:hypothetical protein
VIYSETGDPIVLGLFGAVRVLPYIVLSVPAGTSPTATTGGSCCS